MPKKVRIRKKICQLSASVRKNGRLRLYKNSTVKKLSHFPVLRPS